MQKAIDFGVRGGWLGSRCSQWPSCFSDTCNEHFKTVLFNL